jgi:hypothetical protein
MGRFRVGLVVCARACGLQARYLMLKTPGVWYLVTLFASLGLLSAIALDALHGRSPGHVLAFAPSPASGGAKSSGLPGSQAPQIKPLVAAADPSAPPATRTSAFGTQAIQAAPPAPSGITPAPPSVIAPTPAVQAMPQWPPAAVTTSTPSIPAGGWSVSVPRRSQECAATWDRETHMTKEEWKAACERTQRRP